MRVLEQIADAAEYIRIHKCPYCHSKLEVSDKDFRCVRGRMEPNQYEFFYVCGNCGMRVYITSLLPQYIKDKVFDREVVNR